jgi:hypothetical protein
MFSCRHTHAADGGSSYPHPTGYYFEPERKKERAENTLITLLEELLSISMLLYVHAIT